MICFRHPRAQRYQVYKFGNFFHILQPIYRTRARQMSYILLTEGTIRTRTKTKVVQSDPNATSLRYASIPVRTTHSHEWYNKKNSRTVSVVTPLNLCKVMFRTWKICWKSDTAVKLVFGRSKTYKASLYRWGKPYEHYCYNQCFRDYSTRAPFWLLKGYCKLSSTIHNEGIITCWCCTYVKMQKFYEICESTKES